LAACANVIPRVSSIFRWKDSISNVKESLIVLKTCKSLFRPLEKRVKALHTYSIPEIIALPVVLGSRDYLRWIRQSTR